VNVEYIAVSMIGMFASSLILVGYFQKPKVTKLLKTKVKTKPRCIAIVEHDLECNGRHDACLRKGCCKLLPKGSVIKHAQRITHMSNGVQLHMCRVREVTRNDWN